MVSYVGKFLSKFIEPAGKYDHNPFVGPRPMVYPYTMAAKIAQFPYVFHYRYTIMGRTCVPAFLILCYIIHKYTMLTFEPSNVEYWKQVRKEWYGRHYPPEYDLH